MLEKTTIKYTRNGVEANNLASGESSLKTLSAYGKQTRYQGHQTTAFQNDVSDIKTPLKQVSSNTTRGVQSLISQNSFRYNASDNESELNRRKFVEDSPSLNALSQVAHGTRITRKAIITTSKNTAKAVKNINSFTNNSAIKKSKSGIKTNSNSTSFTKGINRYSSKIVSSTTNEVNANLRKSDSIGLQTVGKSYQAATKSVKTAKATQRSIKRAKKIIQTSKVIIKKTVTTTFKIITNPAVLKALLIFFGGILLIIVATSLIATIFGGMFGSTNLANIDTQFQEYIEKLDSDFINEVKKKAEELSQDNSSVTVYGYERVKSSPSEFIALLSVDNEFDVELTQSNKELLKKYHSILNTYSIENHIEQSSSQSVSSKEGSKVIINIESYSVNQKLLRFNLDEDKTEILLAMLDVQSEMEQIRGNKTLIFPLAGYTHITSPYGERIDPITKDIEDFHTGIDICAPLETPIHATLKGKVIFAGKRGTYGNLLLLKHDNGLETYYAHCNAFTVKEGDYVNTNDQIATVGNTGRSTGPHLHFEVRINSRHQNPMIFL